MASKFSIYNDLSDTDTIGKIISEEVDEQFQTLVQYLGFDPIEILDIVENVPDEKKASNIGKLIYLYLSRGTHLANIKKKSSTVASSWIGNMQAKYNIQNTVKDKGAKSVNLARIAAAFPKLTLTTLVSVPQARDNRPVTYASMCSISPDFPVGLMTNIAASVIPKTEEHISNEDSHIVLQAIGLYLVEEAKKLDRSLTNSTNGVIAKKVMPFITSSYSSDLVLEEERVAICTKVLTLFKRDLVSDKRIAGGSRIIIK